MDDSHNWRALLYPGEWGFRFFIAGALVWLFGQELREPIAAVVFYMLVIGVLGVCVAQVCVLAKFVRKDV